MGEIKFRGKNEENGEFVYGYYIKHQKITPYAMYHNEEDRKAHLECEHLIAKDGFSDWGLPKPLNFFKVIPETVGQFTGLKDKNGKEIYDGDIVKWGHANEYSRENPVKIAEVKINPDIQFHSQVGIFKFGSFAYADRIDRDLEVIGNIYENPELLKIGNS